MNNKNKCKKIVIYIVCVVLFLISITSLSVFLKILADNIAERKEFVDTFTELQDHWIEKYGKENGGFAINIKSGNEAIRKLKNFTVLSSIGLILSGYFLFNFTYLMFFYDDKKIMSLEKNRLLSKLEKLKKG